MLASYPGATQPAATSICATWAIASVLSCARASRRISSRLTGEGKVWGDKGRLRQKDGWNIGNVPTAYFNVHCTKCQ